MAFQIRNTRDIALEGVKVLVYGEPGAGKTRLCATAPEPFVLSAESGLLSLQEEGLDYAIIESIDDLNEAYAWINSSEEAKKYKTICLDSISEIAEQVLAEEKNASRDGRKAYGEMADRVTRILRAFRDLRGKHVYFSAKIERTQTDSGAILYAPSLPGRTLTQGVGYFFDEEFALMKIAVEEEVRFVLQTSSDLSYEAKDRSGKLDFYEKPDLTAIFEKISGGAYA